MSEPRPPLRDRIPSRLRALFARRWGGKDIALAVLALLLVSVSAYAFKAPLSAAFARLQEPPSPGSIVAEAGSRDLRVSVRDPSKQPYQEP